MQLRPRALAQRAAAEAALPPRGRERPLALVEVSKRLAPRPQAADAADPAGGTARAAAGGPAAPGRRRAARGAGAGGRRVGGGRQRVRAGGGAEAAGHGAIQDPSEMRAAYAEGNKVSTIEPRVDGALYG